MSSRGRYGKYGEHKRLSRLREARTALREIEKRSATRQKKAPPSPKALTMKSLGIRLARPTDVGYVRELSKSAFAEYGAYDSVLAHWFELNTTLSIVAFQDKRSAGFAMLSRPPRNWPFPFVGELLAIAVERDRWGKGIGGLLMRGVDRAARQMQIERLQLHTAVENAPAQRLFKKHGFVPFKVKEGFYPAGQDALMMIKEV